MTPQTVRCAGYQGNASIHTRALQAFAAASGTLSAGDITVEVTANITASGRKASDLLSLVGRGEIDICYMASSYLVSRVPSLQLLDLPFTIADRQHAYEKLDSGLGTLLQADIESLTGYRLLAYWDNGFRHLSNRFREIHDPDDCRGMRIRILDNALHHEIFGAMGFEPVTIDVKDLVKAVASHAVDAQENPLTNIFHFGLHRSNPHISLTAHLFGVVLLLVNRARFDSWTGVTKQSMIAAAAEATKIQRDLAIGEDQLCLQQLQKGGSIIVPQAEIDLAEFDRVVSAIRTRELGKLDGKILAELAR